MYDLPGNLTWTGRHDFARDTNYLFVNRLLRSEYRTAVAEEADYLFIPAIGNSYDEPRAHSLAYVQATWPSLWSRAGGRDHIMIGCHDAGINGYFGDRTTSEAAMRLIFISHMGHWLGSAKGGMRGGHIPGQDIVIPPSQNLGDVARLPGGYFARPEGSLALRPEDELTRRNGTLLYFAGTVNNNSEPWNVRHQAWLALGSVPGIQIHRAGVGANYTPGMASSLFCLGAPGQGGGWGRRDTLGALHGCIPAFVQDNTSQALDELLPWHLMSVHAAQAELAQLADRLAALRDDVPRVHALLRQLACAWPRFLPSSSYGALGGESGEDDAFGSVLAILRRRLDRAPGSWPENGDVSSPGASAAERQARLRTLQLPDVCAASSVAWTVEGGAPSGIEPAPPPPPQATQLRLPCRHFSSPGDNHCPSELTYTGGAVCLGVDPPCAWPRRPLAQPPAVLENNAESNADDWGIPPEPAELFPPPLSTPDTEGETADWGIPPEPAELSPPPEPAAPQGEVDADDWGIPPEPAEPSPPQPAAALESNADDWGAPSEPAVLSSPPARPPPAEAALAVHSAGLLCGEGGAADDKTCLPATHLQVVSATGWHLSNMEAANVTYLKSGWVSNAHGAALSLALFSEAVPPGGAAADLLFLCATSAKMAVVRLSCAGGCACAETRLDARCAPRHDGALAARASESTDGDSAYNAQHRAVVDAPVAGAGGGACILRLTVLTDRPGHYFKVFGIRHTP